MHRPRKTHNMSNSDESIIISIIDLSLMPITYIIIIIIIIIIAAAVVIWREDIERTLGDNEGSWRFAVTSLLLALLY